MPRSVPLLVGLCLLVGCAEVPAANCDESVCPSGCCDSTGRCRLGNASACGFGGEVCRACAPGEGCVRGVCTQLEVDGGAVLDAGSDDDGGTDPDAGTPDAHVELSDGGDSDAGPPDSGRPDAGVRDAGSSRCAPAAAGFPSDERFARARTTVDQPDDEPGAYQVHVVYIEPSDRTVAAPLDTNGALRRSLEAGLGWYRARSAVLEPRFDRCEGLIDISFFKLPASITERAIAAGLDGTSKQGPAWTRDRLAAAVSSTFNDPKKLYLLVWDGLAYGRCGGAAFPPDIADHFTAMYRGGIFSSTFLTQNVSAGQSSLPVYSTTELPMPAVPFDATLEGEAIRVTAKASNSLTLQSPLTQAHSKFDTVKGVSLTPSCASTPLSANGTSLGYWELATMHEITHPLGIVSRSAPDSTAPPYPYGHVGDSAQAGANDLMYTGPQGWDCSDAASTPLTSSCQIDPQHRNYFQLPASSSLPDLADSAFAVPTPPGAKLPPQW